VALIASCERCDGLSARQQTEPVARRLPFVIARADSGDFSALLEGSFTDGQLAVSDPIEGLYLSVTCSEETARHLFILEGRHGGGTRHELCRGPAMRRAITTQSGSVARLPLSAPCGFL
jgi:hypothetical protein